MRRWLGVLLALLAFPFLAVLPAAALPAAGAVGRIAVAPTSPVRSEIASYSTRVPGVGRTVVLQRRSGTRWLRVTSARSTAGGKVLLHARLTATTRIRVYAAATTRSGRHFRIFRGAARGVTLSAQSGRLSMASSARVSATISTQATFVPARPGRPVQVQRWTGAAWAAVVSGTQGSAGAVAFGVPAAAAGTFTYRAVAQAWHGAAATATASRSVQVVAGACTTACVQPPPALPPGAWADLDAGGKHTCGVRGDGTVWCWGRNQYGQLGAALNSGKDTATPTPVQVGTGTDWVSVTAGQGHSCGVRRNGTAWCWGSNYYGELGSSAGTGARTPVTTPRQVGTGTTWTSLSAGSDYTCGVRSDATAWCWGYNYYGQLGNRTNLTSNLPTPTPTQVGTAGWSVIDAGSSHTCGVRTDGTLRCWGYNYYGQVGTSTNALSLNPTPDPVQVGTVRTWAAVSADGNNSCATRTDGTGWCWGSDYYGQLGEAAPVTSESVHPDPVQVGSGGWSGMSIRGLHACGLRTDGQALCWGDGFNGESGNTGTQGTHDPAPAGTPVPGGAVWRSVTAGGTHSCAIRSDGSGWCWGSNQYGQLGSATSSGATTANPTPLKVG